MQKEGGPLQVNQVRLGAVLSYVSMGLSTLISLIYTPIMLGRLGETEYGVYGAVGPIISYLLLLSMGLGSAYIRYYSQAKVAEVVGPVHKSDIGGVVLNIKSEQHLALEFDRMMQLPEVTAVMVQPMLKGTELFIGAKYEEKFGHVVLCGLGGIFVEVLKDVSSGLAPLSYEEAYSMIRSLRAYKIIKGTRGQKGVNEDKFAEIIVRLSTLLRFATEIKEMDINPLLATDKHVIAVDARIRIEKSGKQMQ